MFHFNAAAAPRRLSPFLMPLLLVAIVAVSTSQAPADRILIQEGRGRNITGTVVGINAERVTVDVRGERQDVPANIVVSIAFDKEPSALAAARSAVTGSRMTEALEALEKLDPATLENIAMRQEYDYFLASSKALLVLSGSAAAADAEKALLDFINNHKNSCHYYEICELYGDVMVQMGKFEDAKKSYAVLAQAPWPEYSLKATVSLGMAEVNEKKTDAARKNFNSVIQTRDDSEQAERLKGMAKVGLALCLVAEKKYDEAIQSLEDIAREATDEDSAFQSLIYNSLGSAYEQAGKPNQAVMSYLYTDILFSASRNEHIKALTELAKLWRKVRRNDRAEAVDKKLRDLYNIPVR